MNDINILNMSDEELANLDPATLEQAAPQEGDQTTTQDEPGDENSRPDEVQVDAGDEDQPNEGAEDDKANKQEQGDGSQGDPEPEADQDGTQQGEPSAKKPQGKPAKGKPEAGKEPVQEQSETAQRDYKAEVDRILSPIKANGREIQVDTVDDAIRLMQMGANYHKKMAELKPNLGILKMLEQHGVLDEAKLGFLIDLDKKNPEAIKKLVKESGLDPLDIDLKKEDGYKPGNYTVDHKSVDLDQVLDELKSSTHYADLLTTVGKVWDEASRQQIADNPHVLKALESHIGTGIFDKIANTVATDRALGRLTDMSDLEAYRTVGDRLQAEGKFNGMLQHATTQASRTAPVKPAPKPEDSAAKDKKRAAAPAARGNAGNKPAIANILNMSDEEIAKLDITQFTTR